MSIDLNLTTPLQNASIQYTYPEMDIRSIVKANTISFKFRNGLSSSSFSFTDTDNSIFKSGVASEGTISTGLHKIGSKNIGSYELTVKHITSTQNDFFYVVFPIESGDKTSFINSIVTTNSNTIDVINMSDADNKSLNSMIIDSGSVYKYTSSDGKLVFVFNTPITTSLSNIGGAVTSGHSLWNLTTQPILINLISQGDNEKVSEEIVCEYSGDTEQTINNEPLNRGAAKIGWTTLVFILLALWIGYFYSIPFIKNNIIDQLTNYGWGMIGLNVLLIIIVFASVYGSNARLSMYQTPAAILLFIILLWPIDFAFRICAYLVLWMFNNISTFDDVFNAGDPLSFVKGYLNSDATTATANTFAKYALYVLFAIWIIAIFAIVSK